jgi:thiol-disulfide isomerase/thioredoxin
MRKSCLFLLNLALLGLSGCAQHDGKPLAERREPPVALGEVGSRLPEFFAKDLQGHEVSSARLHGKVVLVDFWATWCQPCKKEMPGYQALLEKYGSQDFAVVGFKFDTMMDTEDPVSFAKKLRVRYPLVIATDDIKARFGGIEGLPTTMIYDRAGILRKKVIGFEYTDVFESALKSLL